MKNLDDKELVQKINNETDVSVYAYDSAIVRDLRARFNKDPDNPTTNNIVQITPFDRAFKVMGNMDEDNITLPFISINRTGWGMNGNPHALLFQGDLIETTYIDDKKTNVRAQCIPIYINYQMDILTADRVTNDAIIRELLFYYKMRPTLCVNVLHGLNFTHEFNIYFDDDVEDNSDIVSFDDRGTYFRQTLNFHTDDAYLWKPKYVEQYPLTLDLMFFDTPISKRNLEEAYRFNKSVDNELTLKQINLDVQIPKNED